MSKPLTIYNGLLVLKGRINGAMHDAHRVENESTDEYEQSEARTEREAFKRVLGWLDDTVKQYPDRSVFGECAAPKGQCRSW